MTISFGVTAYYPALPALVDSSLTPQEQAQVAKASTAMDALIKNDTFLKSLAAHTVPVLPPSNQLILATLWGHFDTNENPTFNKADVQQALADDGITDSETVNALWRQIDPRGTASSISAQNFGKNPYIISYIQSHADTIDAAVLDMQLKGGPSINGGVGLLSTFFAMKNGTFGSADTSQRGITTVLDILA